MRVPPSRNGLVGSRLLHGEAFLGHVLGGHVPARPAAAGDDLAGVPDDEQGAGEEHEGRVEDVQPDLGLLQGAAEALGVLDGAEDGADQDEGRDGVQHIHEALPGDRDGPRRLGRLPHRPPVEDGRHHDEDGEADQLHHQAADDDVLAQLEAGLVLGAREHAASTIGLTVSETVLRGCSS